MCFSLGLFFWVKDASQNLLLRKTRLPNISQCKEHFVQGILILFFDEITV